MTNPTNGKGSKPRPYSVTREVYELRHKIIWGTAEEKEEAKKKLKQMGEL